MATTPPLSEPAAAMLAGQLAGSSSELPAFSALVASLGICSRHSRAPRPEARLPRRVLAAEPAPFPLREPSLWKAYYEGALHEILSEELVGALAAHLRAVLPSSRGASGSGLPVVLECGAGSGALATHLQRRLSGVARVVACDDRSSRIATQRGGVEVLRMAVNAALAAFAPDVCLVSWMPSGADWSGAMRACPSVASYVLLGEADSSTCGDAWATWGVLPPNHYEYGLEEDTPPPHAQEGFVRTELESVSRWQVCRFDSALERGFSTAVAFERVQRRQWQ